MDDIKAFFLNKTIAIIGFGREGRSTYNLIRTYFPDKHITILDENEAIIQDSQLSTDKNLTFVTGNNFLRTIDDFDIAIKSPGIPSNKLPGALKKVQITSQTDIFLKYFGHKVIGVTGTKGKSTTSSLIFQILKTSGRTSILVGNIGIRPFECLNDINDETVIVMELSSHQLEYISHSPHIAILLNIFQEHLDHYHSYKDYQNAKFNIGKFQNADDYFIYNIDNEIVNEHILEKSNQVQTLLPFSLISGTDATIVKENNWITLAIKGIKNHIYDCSLGQNLPGNHNLGNIMAASAACFLADVPVNMITEGVRSFKGLEHRIEPVGTFDGITWYNDSIATIPEATIEAVKTLGNVNTLILGGFDRGIDYSVLYPFLNQSEIKNIIFVGKAGSRMEKELKESGITKINLYQASDYTEVVTIARKITKKGTICLLSPAAASYDMFKNFEERGQVYKTNVRNLGSSQ